MTAIDFSQFHELAEQFKGEMPLKQQGSPIAPIQRGGQKKVSLRAASVTIRCRHRREAKGRGDKADSGGKPRFESRARHTCGAVNYMINQKESLRNFLLDDKAELSNNYCE